MTSLGPLPDDGRVAIIGGGPGGVGCALAVRALAQQMGRRIHITIIEGKDFAGERHHNLCVGIVSPPLPELVEQRLGVACPEHLRQGVITTYVLHASHEEVALENTAHPSFAIRRVQFDHYMLETARRLDIAVVEARASGLEFSAERVVIYTDGASVEADVVVGAFGLDEGAAEVFRQAVGYRPPRALVSLLVRYYPGHQAMQRFGGRIHAFLPGFLGMEFGAITPKGDHLNANIAGRALDVGTMQAFLARPEVKALLPDDIEGRPFDLNRVGLFRGRFPRSLAGAYYGDRYVMVGDAAGLVRAFKGKGVTSAVQTGIRAAETILQAGVSRAAFASHYEAANRDIIGDLRFGRAVRLMVLLSSRYGLLDPVMRAARHDAGVREALYGAVSAHQPYRQVLGSMLNLRSVAAVLRALV